MRKIFGVLLLLLSAFLGVMLITFIPQLVNSIFTFIANGAARSFGFLLGQLLAFLLPLALSMHFWFLGLQAHPEIKTYGNYNGQ
jgi:hypothetical protein